MSALVLLMMIVAVVGGLAYFGRLSSEIERLSKRLGDVEDIGNAALFLASEEAAYITGQTIIVDGGQILPESLEALASA